MLNTLEMAPSGRLWDSPLKPLESPLDADSSWRARSIGRVGNEGGSIVYLEPLVVNGSL